MPPTLVNSFAFGRSTDTPIVGNWNGEGGDEIGVVRGNVWYLANDVPPTSAFSFAFGRSNDTPITGDFDGDGDDEIGVVRENVWYFADEAPPTAAFSFAFGRATDIQIIGDWDARSLTRPTPTLEHSVLRLLRSCRVVPLCPAKDVAGLVIPDVSGNPSA